MTLFYSSMDYDRPLTVYRSKVQKRFGFYSYQCCPTVTPMNPEIPLPSAEEFEPVDIANVFWSQLEASLQLRIS